MASLEGQTHLSTYKDLLQVSNSNAGIDATRRAISDGEGTASVLLISTGSVSVDNILIDGNTISALDTGGSIVLAPSTTGVVSISGTSSSAAEIRLAEDTDNGTNYIGLKAAASLAASVTFTLPSADGTSGYVLTTNGSGTLSWTTQIIDIVLDTTPQLGGNLDANAFNIQFDTATGIQDDSANEQITFVKTASAVNELTVTNAATGTAPSLKASGGDTNVDLKIGAKGTGAVVVTGTSTSSAEVRLSEDTDNGVNYIGLKAPASVASNLSFTLPSTDGTSGQVLSTDAAGTLSFVSQSPRPNLLDNGQFTVCERRRDYSPFTATTTVLNSDDTYLIDRWVWLADGNDICDVSVSSAQAPTSAVTALKLDVETANKKFGIFQILESMPSRVLIGGTASLSFQAKKSGSNVTAETLRAAIVSWSGTADGVTSDLVSSWASAGTDPTLVANWTYENTPSNLTLTSSYQTFSIPNISIDTASAANVGVFIWCDDTDSTVEDLIYISNVKLEAGTTVTPYVMKDINTEIVQCKRFFQLMNNGSNQQTTGDALVTCIGPQTTSIPSGVLYASTVFPVEFRISPTVTIYPNTTPTNTGRCSNNTPTDQAANSAIAWSATTKYLVVYNNSGGAFSSSTIVYFSWFGSADL